MTSTEQDSYAWTCITWTGFFQVQTDVHASIFSGVFFFQNKLVKLFGINPFPAKILYGNPFFIWAVVQRDF